MPESTFYIKKNQNAPTALFICLLSIKGIISSGI